MKYWGLNLMSDICQQISDAYLSGNTAKVINLMPEFTRQHEAGLIVGLPCKVGDTVYAICENNSVLKTQVMGFEYQNGVWAISTVNFNEHGIKNIHWFRFDVIGKTVFLTEQEAKEALEGKK